MYLAFNKKFNFNLMSKLEDQWPNFQKLFYSCLNESEEYKFIKKQEDLNENFTDSTQYLKSLENIKEKH